MSPQDQDHPTPAAVTPAEPARPEPAPDEPVADADPPVEVVGKPVTGSDGVPEVAGSERFVATGGVVAGAEPVTASEGVVGESAPVADDARPEPFVAPDEAVTDAGGVAGNAEFELVVATGGSVTESEGSPGELMADDARPEPQGSATGEGPATGDTPDDQSPADADPPTEVLDETPELTDAELEAVLEALLLVVDSPVDEESLAAATDTTVARVNDALLRMAATYTEHDRGLDLRHAGGGWRYYTRDRYAPYVEKLLLGGQRAKLTRAALETLAVIAYRQPVTRARVAAVRGVNCDGVIRTLLARGLVEETGTDQETGGFLYRTTELFLERLGLASLEDLPPIAPLLPEVDSIDDI